MNKPNDSLKAKKDSSTKRSVEYEAVLNIVREARSWLEIKQVSLLSEVSIAKCRVLLPQMVAQKQITSILKTNSRHPDGVEMYAKPSMAKCQAKPNKSESGFEIAKSRFQLRPELMDGTTHQVYCAKPLELHSLAMLSRRA